MQLPDTVDVEVYFDGSLLVLRPKNEAADRWIRQNLKPTGWQFGPAGTYLADRGEFVALTAWLRRDGIAFVVMNPDDSF